MTRAIRAIQFCSVALTLVLFGSVARAEPKQKIAVLGVETVVGANGQIDPGDTQFAKELTKELRSRANNSKNFTLVKDQRELVDEKLMNNCGSEAAQCMAPIGGSMGADVLLFGKVANAKNGGYKVSLTLIDVKKRQGIGSDPNATITAGEKSNPALGNWVKEHYKKVTNESSEGQLIITVAGANSGKVFINNEVKDTLKSGSATITLPEGRYRVGVDADGFKLWEQEVVTISSEKPALLNPTLEKSKVVTPPPPPPDKGVDDPNGVSGTVDLQSREGTVSGKKNKTVWKVAAGVGLGGAVIGGVFIAYSFKQMRDFKGADVDGAGWLKNGETVISSQTNISQSDCGKGQFENRTQGVGNASSLNDKFDSACNARDRMNWLVPTTLGFAAIGAGALIYVMMSKDEDSEQRPAAGVGRRAKKSRNLIVTPVVTPDNTGATLRFDW